MGRAIPITFRVTLRRSESALLPIQSQSHQHIIPRRHSLPVNNTRPPTTPQRYTLNELPCSSYDRFVHKVAVAHSWPAEEVRSEVVEVKTTSWMALQVDLKAVPEVTRCFDEKVQRYVLLSFTLATIVFLFELHSNHACTAKLQHNGGWSPS